MGSNLYKIILCIVVALCGWEAIDYIFTNTPPNSDIAFVAMLTSVWLLIERLYIILIVEQIKSETR